MTDEVSLVVSGDDPQEQYVQVPIKRKDFGDFVTNLLGQPETITERKSGKFEATYEWLVHLHHLLDQRIKQQVNSDLVDFSAVFKYSDGPDRKITTVEGFLNFNEAKIVTTKSVKLTWTYLINFPNKPTPEKQEISLRLITDRAEVLTVGSSSVIRHTTNKNGVASYTISHTERTWGDDISALLGREVESIFQKDTWYSKIFENTVIFIALGLFAAGLIIPDYLDQLIKEKETAQIFTAIVPEGKGVESLSVDQKLNLAIKLLDPNNQLHKVEAWYRVLSLVAGIFLAVFTIILFEKETPSFIVVTNEDKKRKAENERKDTKSMVKKVLSFIAAIAAGVAGNYLYYYINL
ncbi:MAG: hypothetical protein AB2605_04135 [Candidatus Thiodiazotropha sp.]